MINLISHELTNTLSKNYKWLFNTYDITILIKNKQLVFLTIRYFVKFQKDWKETKELMEKTRKVIENCKQEIGMTIPDSKRMRKITLGFIDISWFEEK